MCCDPWRRARERRGARARAREDVTLALALALQLLVDAATAVPESVAETTRAPSSASRRTWELRLVPRLTLDAGTDPGAPDLAAGPPAEAPGPRPVRFKVVAASAAGVVVGDLAAAIPVTAGLLMCVEDVSRFGSTGGCAAGIPLMIAGAVAFLVVPPASGVLGARLAGEDGDAGGRAYAIALLVRLAAFGVLAALPNAAGGVAVAGVELAVTPYLIARVLAGATPRARSGASGGGLGGGPAGLSPAALAVPVGGGRG